ncbi:hypothetical protein MNBD_PLANCTO03-727, partial [hydrothermal vent metagenome]
MKLTPNQELELQALSGAAQRRNQPRFLLALGVVLILVAGFYAFSGYGAAKTAMAKAQLRADTAGELDELIVRYNTLSQGGDEGALSTRFPVNSRVRSTLETTADIAGLEEPLVTKRDERQGLDYPLVRQVFTASLSDAPLEPTLKWINSAT